MKRKTFTIGKFYDSLEKFYVSFYYNFLLLFNRYLNLLRIFSFKLRKKRNKLLNKILFLKCTVN